MQELSYDFVSDEEDGPEGNWIIRSPRWRSPRASELTDSRLQRRIDQTREDLEVQPRVPRVEGPLLDKPRPKVDIPVVNPGEGPRPPPPPLSQGLADCHPPPPI